MAASRNDCIRLNKRESNHGVRREHPWGFASRGPTRKGVDAPSRGAEVAKPGHEPGFGSRPRGSGGLFDVAILDIGFAFTLEFSPCLRLAAPRVLLQLNFDQLENFRVG